ncbi:MAG: Ldh family oxidoreductase [Clostridia bacterium]|nr:Ldh family oxidoreductase [Clostridia bacterium]
MAKLINGSAVFEYDELKDWGLEVCKKVGIGDEEASVLVDVLLLTNLRGIDTHGITMLPSYAERYSNIEHFDVKTEKDHGAGVVINGGNHTGQYVTMLAIDEACKRADKYGIGFADVKEINHSGAMGVYGYMLAKRGYIGLATTNSMPLIAPWGGLKPLFGNNPFSIAVPDGDTPFVLDIANSVVARQKIYNYQREGKPIPEGWATDAEGNVTTDPTKALEGTLLAIGGHKGTGIALMIDVILGLFAGGSFGVNICPNVVRDRPQHVSQLIMAIKPDFYMDKGESEKAIKAYKERFYAIPAKKGARTYLPGEIELITQADREKNGIPITLPRLKEMNEFNEKFGLARIELE